MEAQEFIIKQNKKGNIKYSLGSLVMCVASLLSLFVNMSEDPFLIQFIMKSILVIGFFILGMVRSIISIE